jgi:hypothetical protein
LSAAGGGGRGVIWAVLGLIAVEIIGVVGLVIVLNGGLEQFALIAVCLALIVVPIVLGIAMRSELRGRRK